MFQNWEQSDNEVREAIILYSFKRAAFCGVDQDNA